MTCFLSDKKLRLQGEVVNFTLLHEQKHMYGYLVENTEKIVLEHPFNEMDITKFCLIDKESITYKNLQNTFTAIDVIVTICKFYLENAINNTSKWFFRRIKIFKPIDKIKFQQIKLKKTKQKRNIVEFYIYIDNELIAHGYGASISYKKEILN